MRACNSLRETRLNLVVTAVLVLAAATLATAAQAQTAHQTMTMDASATAAAPSEQATGHDMTNMPGMETGASSPGPASPVMGSMQGGRPPASARDPYAYAGGYQRSTMPNAETADALRLGAIFLDQLEVVRSDQGSGAAWDVQAWYGGPFNRAWLRSEGDVRKGRLEDGSIEGLWFRSFGPFWGTQLGVRHDVGDGPDRTWAALGVQGTTPYWYGMEATAYVGEGGRTAARLKAGSDLRFTQRLVLRPELEANLYGRSDKARGLGGGLATFQTELRLRYEIRREFAPYVGVVWNRAFGETETLRRAATGENDEVQFVVGLKLWR
jgi:copper resistance protein B